MTPAARAYGSSAPACVVYAAYRPGGWVSPGQRAVIAKCGRQGYAIARAEREAGRGKR